MKRFLNLLFLLLASCGNPSSSTGEGQGALDDAIERPVLLCLGDSLTAGFGVAKEEAWPALLQEKIDSKGLRWDVRNAGTSGSTTKGVLEGLDWHLDPPPGLVILTIGGNDGLRGLDLEQSQLHLDEIVERLKSAGATVVLGGMKLPPNYGKDYSEDFESMYGLVAVQRKIHLIPFILQGVGGVPRFNLPDRIHPNPAGHRIISELVFDFLKKEKLL